MVCSVSGEIPNHPQGAGDRFVERRSVPRFRMIVDIEVFEPIQRTKLTAQLAEIGVYGCYVCVPTPRIAWLVIESSAGAHDAHKISQRGPAT